MDVVPCDADGNAIPDLRTRSDYQEYLITDDGTRVRNFKKIEAYRLSAEVLHGE